MLQILYCVVLNYDSRNAILKFFLGIAVCSKLVDNLLVKSYNASILGVSLA